MMPKAKAAKYTVLITATVNGRIGKALFRFVSEDGKTAHSDRANVADDRDRSRLIRRAAEKLNVPEEAVRKLVEQRCNEFQDDARRRQEQAAAAPPAAEEAAGVILDASPDTVRRPLCLLKGRSYAATWLHLQVTVRKERNKAGELVEYNPPLVRDEQRLVVVRGDGALFADEDAHLRDARPLSELGLSVTLPTVPPPSRLWSGAGVKAFLAGVRPDPADVFRRLTLLVDTFMDFDRSFGSQGGLCELVACYVLATYLLDAFNVAGYLWSGGDKGSGKTTLLIVVGEVAYLGQVVLAGGSYASLRDLADYGATLAFDDAENVMDVKKFDPDKRALLLAGNRRGATVTVKELTAEKVWATRHVDTFCFRLFSAIRLPDFVLASRSITLPLVRSADPQRAKANPTDHESWPCDRRQLVDDLWAVGLSHLPALKKYDAEAAARVSLSGRDLEPWRALLAVALWLEECHGVRGLFGRVERLMHDYQRERCDFEATHATRLLFRALLDTSRGKRDRAEVKFAPKDLAERMNRLAWEDDLVDEGEKFTSPSKVGRLLKQQRFRRDRTAKSRLWETTRREIVSLAAAYGVREDPAGQ
jgi:hypothetical protein